jgi:hypothetical protein
MTAVTHARETSAPLSYRFGTGAPAGVWLGLGLSRLAILGVGLLTTIGLLGMRSGLPLGIAPLALAAAVTLVPVAGRPLSGWVAPATRHGQATAVGSARWSAAVPHTPVDDGAETAGGARLRLPPEHGRWRLFEVCDPAAGACPVAVLREPRSAAATLLFTVAGPDRFALLDADGQDRLIGGWGRTLTGFAQRDRGITRLQLLERVTVAESDLDDATAWVTHRGERARSELTALTDIVEASTVRRESLVAVQVSRAGEPQELLTRARDIAGQLLAAELVARPLAAAEITSLFRRLLYPGDEPCGDIGPVSRRTAWDHVRVDDTWHRSYAVSGWPGSPVSASWLSALLVATPPCGTWTVATHMAAVSPESATRIARAARAKAELDRADRARLGMPDSAAADKAVIESAGMDAELVAGHATHRLATVLTCSAASVKQLEECGRALRDAASGAGLMVRPLHGQHHLALAATLPLCRLRLGGVA